jgi:hypothetical protein
MKGLPSPEELEKMIEGAAKMGAQQAAEPQHMTEVQKLTQENLAKLVKETAIKSGAVMPGGYRRASTALPQAPTKTMIAPTASAPRKAQTTVNGPTAERRPATTTKTNQSSPAVNKKAPAPTKPKPTGPMKEVTLASGVTIKVPKTEVEDAKKTGMIVLKNGMRVKIEKSEIEEAQKKKGATVVTASGVPIKVSPSGAIVVEQKSNAQQPAKKTSAPAKNAPTAAKTAPKAARVVQKSTGPTKLNEAPAAQKKTSAAAGGATKKPVTAPAKGKAMNTAPRKL